MLLYDLGDPAPGEMWLKGARFRTTIVQPVIVTIKEDFENAELLPWFGTPPVMSDAFHEALLEVGVDNLDSYDAVLRSEDDKVEYKGFKAVNVVGLVSAADLSKTVFSPHSKSHLIDAHIDSLAIDADKAKGLLIFRLAEYVGAVIVHEKIKQAIERRGFPHVIFSEPGDFLS